jgi:hypothetical protein
MLWGNEMDATRRLIEAARREAARLNELATTADDRGARIIIQQAENWLSLAFAAEQELRGGLS